MSRNLIGSGFQSQTIAGQFPLKFVIHPMAVKKGGTAVITGLCQQLSIKLRSQSVSQLQILA